MVRQENTEFFPKNIFIVEAHFEIGGHPVEYHFSLLTATIVKLNRKVKFRYPLLVSEATLSFGKPQK